VTLKLFPSQDLTDLAARKFREYEVGTEAEMVLRATLLSTWFEDGELIAVKIRVPNVAKLNFGWQRGAFNNALPDNTVVGAATMLRAMCMDSTALRFIIGGFNVIESAVDVVVTIRAKLDHSVWNLVQKQPPLVWDCTDCISIEPWPLTTVSL